MSWERPATKSFFQHYFSLSKWIADQIQFCRYSNIPIGNLERDFITQAADLSWARILSQKDSILWVSTSKKPDFGGHETEDSTNAEELFSPEINNPGFYKTISIELHISDLAFNTMICANTSDLDVISLIYLFYLFIF